MIWHFENIFDSSHPQHQGWKGKQLQIPWYPRVRGSLLVTACSHRDSESSSAAQLPEEAMTAPVTAEKHCREQPAPHQWTPASTHPRHRPQTLSPASSWNPSNPSPWLFSLLPPGPSGSQLTQYCLVTIALPYHTMSLLSPFVSVSPVHVLSTVPLATVLMTDGTILTLFTL